MKNIHQRIASIMADVEYLSKDDTVSTGTGRGYRAITEEKVTSSIRAAMVKHGVTIYPVAMHHTRVDEPVHEKMNRITTVDVEYRIQNIDDPDDYILVASSGTGVDTQDKGVGKAMTYAYKYMLLRTFAIPTGEDPDKISSDLYTEQLNSTGGMSSKRAKILVDIKATKWSEEKLDKASIGKYGKTLMQLSDEQLEEVLTMIVGKEK